MPTQNSTAAKPLISLDDALSSHNESYLDLYAQHINRIFVSSLEPLRLIKRYVRAEGTYLWDDAGNKYYDFFNGYGCLNLGHNHPKVVSAVQRALQQQLPMIHQLVPSPLEAALAHNLAALLPDPLQVCYFQNSGSEAIEASIKLARSYTGRKHLLSAHNGYHGMTFGALSLTAMNDYQAPFEPLLPFVQHVPFGDADALEAELKTRKYAAFYLEPIQGQGGVKVAPAGYLQFVRERCDRYGTLLVLDEVQSGMGRTGKMFAFEHDNVVPDILTVSKSLGGGILPLSACITSDKIWTKVYGSLKKFLLHCSTFSGNSLACICGLAAIATIVEEQLCESCTAQGAYFKSELERIQAKHKVISEVRGRGLMLGITFDLSNSSFLNYMSRLIINAISAKIVTSYITARFLNEFKIIVSPSLTHEYLLRLYPPLNVSREDIDYFIASLDSLCESLITYNSVLEETVVRFVKHYAKKAEAS